MITFVCAFMQASNAQLMDSVRRDLQHKPVFHYKLDSRSAFIGNRNANIWGIKVGIGFNRNIKFGIGYNYLKSRLPAKENVVVPYTGTLMKARLRLRYLSFYTEYIYYRKNKWELSVPVQIGLGKTNYVSFLNPESNYQTPKHFIFLYEPCLSVNYRIIPFVAVGTEMGLRLALFKNRQIKEQITAPIYVFRVSIYWSDMINYFWPNHKIPKPVMDLL